MKLAIIGSRTAFPSDEQIALQVELLERQCHTQVDTIVTGGAKGADKAGIRFAKSHNLKTTIFYPDWNRHGRSAGFKRNVDIIAEADVVLAFWDYQSKGTKHSIDLAHKAGKLVRVVRMET